METNKERAFNEIDRAINFYAKPPRATSIPLTSTADVLEDLGIIKDIVQLVSDRAPTSNKKALSLLKQSERLLDGLPLIALENEDEDWIMVDEDHKIYQHRYRSSLIKKVVTREDSKEKEIYIDTDIITCIGIGGHGVNGCDGQELPPISKGYLSEYVSSTFLFPDSDIEASFPYFPTNRFRVYYCHPNHIPHIVKVLKMLHPSGALLPFEETLVFNENWKMWVRPEAENEK